LVQVIHPSAIIRGIPRESAFLNGSNSIRQDWLGTVKNSTRMAADHLVQSSRVFAGSRVFVSFNCSKSVSPIRLGTHWNDNAQKHARTRESTKEKNLIELRDFV
jgi:hypothetical protein